MTCTSRWPVCPEGSRVAVKTDNPGWCEIMGGTTGAGERLKGFEWRTIHV